MKLLKMMLEERAALHKQMMKLMESKELPDAYLEYDIPGKITSIYMAVLISSMSFVGLYVILFYFIKSLFVFFHKLSGR